MQEYMKDHCQTTPASAPLVKSQKDTLDNFLKAYNPNLYYCSLYMKYYYFYQ